ncbi:MAG: potassium transporter Kup [Gemmatimonadetes bacterium]|nr:MAG: potassium transporter Kup [Gemmatimonadota bacterium]
MDEASEKAGEDWVEHLDPEEAGAEGAGAAVSDAVDGGHAGGDHGSEDLKVLALAALGVVFGDIGTSPIYALRESLHPGHGVTASPENVVGVLSLIFWSLILVISIKYLGLVMKADNRGEGGIIALTALVSPPSETPTGRRKWLVLVGLFGAALLYGDSMITPAISVLSAVEGLEVATPVFQPYVIPITIGILIALFAFQSRGTAGIGAIFGPVMLVWFGTLALLGLLHIADHPDILGALSPHHAVSFFARNGAAGIIVLGSVFLVVTGGEALYADMGHFGRRPIRLTWFAVVLPCLMINYLGQGALVLAEPEAIESPFFLLAPRWALYPLVTLTTAATIIASQAVISGAFSLTRQAIQLGYLPRLRVDHTSEEQIGQIYMPAVNWALMLACIGLVLGFGSSSRLAAAYGVAVTTDMVFTTLLFAVVAAARWKWPAIWVGLLVTALLTIDFGFWFGNVGKIPHGGWFPLAVAGLVFVIMTTWKTGRRLLAERLRDRRVPSVMFVDDVRRNSPHRVPGTAVYMDSNPTGTPMALLHNLKHNKVLHEKVIFLTVQNHEIPYVDEAERVTVEDLGENIFRVIIHVGFAESPNVLKALQEASTDGESFAPQRTSFFLSRETLIPSRKPGMARWRKRIFALMARNAQSPTNYFRIPANRVVELGMQVEV